MPKEKETIYLNTAGCGLISPAALQAGTDLYKGFEKNASAASEHWRNVDMGAIRENISAFMGARSEHIALIPNFSYGINAVVQSLKGNEKVLLYKKDFPSVFIPFTINNFDIVWIDDEDDFFIDPDKLEAAIMEQQINIVAISQIHWQSGFKLDVKRLCDFCRKNGVWTVIDGTQSLGSIAISMQDLQPDVFIASNYKWMNAGFGTGLLYMNTAFANTYPPRFSGAHSNAYSFPENKFIYNGDATNYEPGSVDMFGFSVLNKAIEEKNKWGMAQIEAHNSSLTATLLAQLTNLPVELIGGHNKKNRGSIVVLKDADQKIYQQLLANNITTTGRNGTVRISLHFYNTAKDIEKLVTVLAG